MTPVQYDSNTIIITHKIYYCYHYILFKLFISFSFLQVKFQWQTQYAICIILYNKCVRENRSFIKIQGVNYLGYFTKEDIGTTGLIILNTRNYRENTNICCTMTVYSYSSFSNSRVFDHQKLNELKFILLEQKKNVFHWYKKNRKVIIVIWFNTHLLYVRIIFF